MSDVFVGQLEALERRLSALWEESCGFDGAPMPSPPTLAELSTAVEELHLAAEELLIAEARIAEEQRHYRELFELAPDGYVVTDSGGVILDANEACTRLSGVPAGQLIGRPLTAYLGGGDERGPVDDVLARLRAGSGCALGEFRLRRCGAAELPVTVRCGVTRTGDGSVAEVRWLIRDDTDRTPVGETWPVAAEQRPEDADRHTPVDRVTPDLLDLLSHDVRGPLVDLREVISDVVEAMSARARSRAPRIAVSLPSEPVLVRVDRARVGTILTNLLDSAVRYSPDEPAVTCRVEATPGAGAASVTVSDTGMGVADMEIQFHSVGRSVFTIALPVELEGDGS